MHLRRLSHRIGVGLRSTWRVKGIGLALQRGAHDWVGRIVDLTSGTGFVTYLAIILGTSILSLYLVVQPARRFIKRAVIQRHKRSPLSITASTDRRPPLAQGLLKIRCFVTEARSAWKRAWTAPSVAARRHNRS